MWATARSLLSVATTAAVCENGSGSAVCSQGQWPKLLASAIPKIFGAKEEPAQFHQSQWMVQSELVQALERERAKVRAQEDEIAKLAKEVELGGREKVALEREAQRLASRPHLSVSRAEKLLQASRSREAEIAAEIVREVPAVPAQDAKEFAFSIDTFESFAHPETLRTEVVDKVLIVHFPNPEGPRGWRIAYPQGNLTGEDFGRLRRVVDGVITKQRELFPRRRLVQETFSKHLQGVPNVGEFHQAAVDLDHAAVQTKCKVLERTVLERFEAAFRDLDAKDVDSDIVLLASWKPLILESALWVMTYCDQAHGGRASAGALAEDRAKVVSRIVELYELLRIDSMGGSRSSVKAL